MEWLNSIPLWLKITLGIIFIGVWLLDWLTPLFDGVLRSRGSKKDGQDS